MKTGKEDGAVYGREQPGQLSVISFTENGKRLSRVIKETMGHMEVTLYTKHGSSQGQECEIQLLPVDTSVGMWAKTQMEQGSAMVFIGACGIAVRAVAPYITDKLHDCPVLVMDELGKYVIPVLAGHIGGANQLACQLAEKTGAQPVITTATDLNGKFAVDLFAKRNRLFIEDSRGIGSVSARALEGKLITKRGYGIERNIDICRDNGRTKAVGASGCSGDKDPGVRGHGVRGAFIKSGAFGEGASGADGDGGDADVYGGGAV